MFEKLFGGDPQSQGSLAAIAQILQASGPSRTPRGLYQILGSGMAAGQEATQQAQQLSQQSQLRGLQIQEAQSEMQTKEAQRKRAQEFLDFQTAYGKSRGGQQQAMPMPSPQSAESVFRSLLGGADMPTAGGMSPQQPAMGDAAPAQAGVPSGAGGSRNALVQERLQYAQALRDRGFSAEANAAEDQALKLQPKVKSLEKVMQDGKAMFAPFFEDGTYGNPVPLEVAEKLVAIDRGGSTDLTNSYTGATVRSMKNSLSPAAAAANALGYANLNLSRDRLNFDKQYKTAAEERAEKEFKLKQQIGKAPTEFQGKSAAFGLRATEADKILGELKYDPAAINSKASVASWPLVGGALGAATNKFGLSDDDQKAEQAQRDFINAVLRQESGAAIADSEFDNARKQYFPQPGDGAGVIAQKARARQLSIQGLQSNAGRAAMTAPAAPAASGGWSIRKVQ